MCKKKFISILISISFFSFSLLTSAIIIVDINGGGDFTTIQEGIDASTNDDTILVYPGTYYENVNFNGKHITLASLELLTGDENYIDSTIIDGNQTGSCIRLDNEETAVIRGFSITNGIGFETDHKEGRLGGGIRAYTWIWDNNLNLSVINCKLYNNHAKGGGGIIIQHSNVYLSGVDIYNNYACGGGGIYVRDDSELIFDETNRCNIYNNYAGAGSDMLGVDTGDIEVIVDTFTVLEPLGYFAEYSQNVHQSGEFTFDIQNYWLETVNQDLYVAPDGDDNNSGLSPDEPLRTIAWAIHKIESDSLDPKTVFVAEGTYSGSNGQILPLGLKSNISLIGENINTILLNDTYASIIIRASYDKVNISIENFTLHSSNDDISTVLFIWEGNNIILRNIIIEYCISIDSYISFIYNTKNILYENVIFRNNSGKYGAGLHQERHNAILSNCIFDNNHSTSWNSNLYFGATDYITIENCIFSNSSVPHPDFTTFIIGEWQFCAPVKNIKNTLFYNNSTPCVAAIGICGDGAGEIGETNITNCTFADNSSSHSTLLLIGEEINMQNTIMYDSTDYEIRLPDCTSYGIVGTLNVDHCNIKNGEDGIWNQNAANVINWSDSNIEEDPLFIGTGDYPFSLSVNSPCIDAGTPDTTGLNLPELDLAGSPRIFNDTIDMGAYEWQGGPGIDEPDYPLFIFDLFQNNPNPFSSKTTISFILASYEHLNEYTLSIYNIRGQLIKTFYGREDNFWVKTDIVWNGTDEDGNKVSPGVYFYKLSYGNNAVIRKMLLIK
ncbi:MAG: DUF1565 domain-containing protein [Candidatus Cloacimonetes bacterium]|nr:DUF1565 domain-containing protein [Candidatus Cloacimonadota bacterium]